MQNGYWKPNHDVPTTNQQMQTKNYEQNEHENKRNAKLAKMIARRWFRRNRVDDQGFDFRRIESWTLDGTGSAWVGSHIYSYYNHINIHMSNTYV